METRHIFSKKERKSSSKHETEWDHQLPNRFLCRISYEVSVKSSVVQREIKVIRNHQSPLMGACRVNHRQRHEVDSDQTENDKTTNRQRDYQYSNNPSLLSLPDETVTEKNNTSSPTVIFSQSKRNAGKEKMAKSSNDNQNSEYLKTHAKTNMKRDDQDSNNSLLLSPPNESVTEKNKTSADNVNFSQQENNDGKEKALDNSDDNHPLEHKQNSSNLNYLNGKPTRKESGLFYHKFTDSKSNFKNKKKHSNLHSSKSHLQRENTNDYSPLTMHSQIPTTSARKDLAGGDHIETDIEDRKRARIKPENSQFKHSEKVLISGVSFNKQKVVPPEEKFIFSKMNDLNDTFSNNETFQDSSGISHSELRRQTLVDEESNSTSSKPFIYPEINAEQAWTSQFLGDIHDDSKNVSGLNLKIDNEKKEHSQSKENFAFEKTYFKKCRSPNKKTYSWNKGRSEINFDKHFISENNRSLSHKYLQLLEHSSLPSELNQELITELKELHADPSYGHKANSSNDFYDLFEKNKRFSHEDCSNNISSISSMSSGDDESNEQSLNNFDSPMNNEVYTETANKNIPFVCSTNDSRQALKNIYIQNKPTSVKLGMESDNSDGNGSLEFKRELPQIRDPMVKFDDKPSPMSQNLRIAITHSNESSSIVTDPEHQSTTASNTYHSDINSDKWKTSVSELVKYFENLSSETEIREKNSRGEPIDQINFAYNRDEDKIENLMNSDINKGNMHDKYNMKNECLSKNKNSHNYENIFIGEHRCFDNDIQTKLSHLLFHKKSKEDEKYHVDENDKHKHKIGNCKENGVQHVDKLEETTPSPYASQADLMHFTTSTSNIHTSQNQLLNLETNYPKESDELTPTDNSPQIGNGRLANDFLQMKRLHPEDYDNISVDDRYKEHNTFSNNRFRAPEIASDRPNRIPKEASDDRFFRFETYFESSGENSVNQKEPLFECLPNTSKAISDEKRNHLESKTDQSSKTREEDQSWSDLQKPIFCDSDVISNIPQRTKLSGQISHSATEKEESFPDSTSKGLKMVGNQSKRVTFRNQNKLVNYWKPPDITLSNDSAEKTCSWNSKGVKKSTENKISGKNQWTCFSRRRAMAFFSMLIVLVFADWYYLLKYFERFSKNQ